LRWIRISLGALGVPLLLVTLLPFIRTGEWWVRIWDFPRLQIAIALMLVLAASLWAWRRDGARWWDLRPRGPGAAAFLGALALGAGYQGARMMPYLPVWPVEMQAVTCTEGKTLRVLVYNVLMTNRDAQALLDVVAENRPDILVLMETDDWWDRAVSELDASYARSLRRPLDNKYGLHVFSRLEWRDAEIRALVEADVPSARMQIRLSGGDWVWFHALHPRPPIPGQDSGPRDAELLIVGQEMKDSPRPSVIMGDMNDVAWSSTTRLFQRISGTLDPRRGRGFYPTFNAKWPLLRWPLDHVFATPEFALIDLKVLPYIGSDHFPVQADLCYHPPVSATQAPEPVTDADRARAAERIRDGHEEAR